MSEIIIQDDAMQKVAKSKILERGDCEVSVYFNGDCKLTLSEMNGLDIHIEGDYVIQDISFKHIQNLIDGLHHVQGLLTFKEGNTK